jgi:hypothetical protein
MQAIVFIEFQNFYLASIRLQEGLNLEEPIALIKDNVVFDVTSSAVSWGVFKGISSRLARQRCPGLVVIPYQHEAGMQLYHKLWSMFTHVTPQIEPVDLHQSFLDLTGCIGPGQTLDSMLHNVLWRIQFESGIHSRWGAGRDKWMARLACGSNRMVRPEEEPSFLEQCPLSRLPIGEGDLDHLFRYGLNTIGKLLGVPRSFFQTHLQWPETERRRLLEREADSVKFLFPPPVLKADCDVHWGSDDEMHAAIAQVVQAAVRQLDDLRQQAGHIRIVLRTAAGDYTFENTLSKPAFSAGYFQDIAERFLLEKTPQHLKTITLELSGLTARLQPQGDLWQDRTSHGTERAERIEALQRVLHQKFGSQTLLSGSQYSRILPPRFAQLIYARRGQYIP